MTDFTIEKGTRMRELFASFKLPTFAEEMVRRLTDAGHEGALPALLEVLEAEADERGQRRTERLLKASRLPPGKTLETLDRTRLPRTVHRQTRRARDRRIPRAGAQRPLLRPSRPRQDARRRGPRPRARRRGHSVLFSPTFRLVQELLAAKRDLELPRALQRLDAFDLLILDDIGYVQQSADEVEVLFTLMAERYERRSLLITSNLVFGEWDRIFKNPMTTAAAIDRLVHHSAILEFSGRSKRADDAESRSKTLAAEASP